MRRYYSNLLGTSRRLSTQASKQNISFDVAPYEFSKFQHSRIIFGNSSVEHDLAHAATESRMNRVLLVRDMDPDSEKRLAYMQYVLQRGNIMTFSYTMTRPIATVECVDTGFAMAKRLGVDGVIAFGGGNVMDTSRAIAALIANDDSSAQEYILDGRGMKALKKEAAPHLIVPTIAGSGSEISTSSLVFDEEAEAKISFTPTPIIAEAVIVDPMLSVTVPEKTTIEGALTAIGQCMESLFLQGKDENVDKYCMEGIKCVSTALAGPLKSKKLTLRDATMRQQFSLASLYSSVASSSTGFGAAHSLGITIGSMSSAPHMEVCAAFLPEVLDQYKRLTEENTDDKSLIFVKKLMTAILKAVNEASGQSCESLAEWVRLVSRTFKLRDAKELGFDDSMIKFVVDRAARRMEDAAKSESILLKRDINEILLGVVRQEDSTSY